MVKVSDTNFQPKIELNDPLRKFWRTILLLVSGKVEQNTEPEAFFIKPAITISIKDKLYLTISFGYGEKGEVFTLKKFDPRGHEISQDQLNILTTYHEPHLQQLLEIQRRFIVESDDPIDRENTEKYAKLLNLTLLPGNEALAMTDFWYNQVMNLIYQTINKIAEAEAIFRIYCEKESPITTEKEIIIGLRDLIKTRLAEDIAIENYVQLPLPPHVTGTTPGSYRLVYPNYQVLVTSGKIISEYNISGHIHSGLITPSGIEFLKKAIKTYDTFYKALNILSLNTSVNGNFYEGQTKENTLNHKIDLYIRLFNLTQTDKMKQLNLSTQLEILIKLAIQQIDDFVGKDLGTSKKIAGEFKLEKTIEQKIALKLGRDGKMSQNSADLLPSDDDNTPIFQYPLFDNETVLPSLKEELAGELFLLKQGQMINTKFLEILQIDNENSDSNSNSLVVSTNGINFFVATIRTSYNIYKLIQDLKISESLVDEIPIKLKEFYKIIKNKQDQSMTTNSNYLEILNLLLDELEKFKDFDLVDAEFLHPYVYSNHTGNQYKDIIEAISNKTNGRWSIYVGDVKQLISVVNRAIEKAKVG
jgi:hypothetical protein